MKARILKMTSIIATLIVGVYFLNYTYNQHLNYTIVRNTIKNISTEQDIPSWIPLSIAFHESKFDPTTVGDDGTSFGLFQLHRGGLAPDYLKDEDLKNIETNTKIAISNMKNAYVKGLQQKLTGIDLLKYVANTSGWPGNKGVTWTEKQTNYNKGLVSSFKMFSKQLYGYKE